VKEEVKEEVEKEKVKEEVEKEKEVGVYRRETLVSSSSSSRRGHIFNIVLRARCLKPLFLPLPLPPPLFLSLVR
jgi:hypothetical protein